MPVCNKEKDAFGRLFLSVTNFFALVRVYEHIRARTRVRTRVISCGKIRRPHL